MKARAPRGSGYHHYQNKINELSAALAAFYAELNGTGEMARVTVVVQSEFGRRVRANANGGTDHGYGNPLLVLGGAVNGRRFYGSWPGLNPETLSPTFGDVPVTTDYRRVMSEILIRRMSNANSARSSRLHRLCAAGHRAGHGHRTEAGGDGRRRIDPIAGGARYRHHDRGR